MWKAVTRQNAPNPKTLTLTLTLTINLTLTLTLMGHMGPKWALGVLRMGLQSRQDGSPNCHV